MMKPEFDHPDRYLTAAGQLGQFFAQANPIAYLVRLTQLKPLSQLVIHHRPLRHRAEFKLPHHIYIDFRQPTKYAALSIAHEYAHLMLRFNRWDAGSDIKKIINRLGKKFTKYNYTPKEAVEQVLAILLQLNYEDEFGIRKFTPQTARELMKVMGVWPTGRALLKSWSAAAVKRHGMINWLRKSFSGG